LRLGGDGTFTYDSNIFLDDVRLTVGSARGYTGATITVPTTAFPDSGPISAPTSLSATAGNGQASLTWTAPAYNGGSLITDYSVQYSSNSGSTWTTFSRTASTTASQVVTGLTNGTAYVFRVAGVNSNGTGTYTAASSSVTPASASVPGAPTSLTSSGSGGCGNIRLSWTAPSDGGSAITSYRIRYNENSYATFYSFSPSGGTASREIALSNLIADGYRTVTIRLSAVNAIGEGSYVTATINPAGDIYQNCG
jgi:hypothetical protein